MRIVALSGTNNWKMWKIRVEDWMYEHDIWGVVDGSQPKPAPVDPLAPTQAETTAIKEWEKRDRKAQACIRRCVDDSVIVNIAACATAEESWGRLNAMYEMNDLVALVSLRKALFSHQMAETTKIGEHISTMQQWYDDLRKMGLDYARPLDWSLALVSSLPKSWDVFVQTLQPEMKKLGDPALHDEVARFVTSAVMAEGQRRDGKDESSMYNKPGSSKSRYVPPQRRQGAGNSYPDKKPGKCNYCGKEGHWAKECYKRKREQGEGGGDTKTNAVAKKETPKKKKKKDKGKKVTIAGGDSEADEEVVYTYMTGGDVNAPKWVIDSGAESHLVLNGNAFHSYTPSPGKFVQGVGGRVPILGEGEVHTLWTSPQGIRSKIVLKNVIHVKDINICLLSVKALDRKGSAVIFSSGMVAVSAPNDTQKIIGWGLQAPGGLYEMRIITLPGPKSAMVAPRKLKTWEQWHRILGHVNQQALERINREGLVEGFHVGESSPTD